MLKKRIIPCLDVKNNKVIKGVQFVNHEIVGDILNLALKYTNDGADELVFYDITASIENRVVSKQWVKKIAELINIPFCVAGGIKTVQDAKIVLANGADKVSINSAAIQNPSLIKKLAQRFGKQCVVIGIDSYEKDGEYYVYQHTGEAKLTKNTGIKTLD
jgi:cyclase